MLTAGAFYKLEFTLSLNAGASVRARVYNTALDIDYVVGGSGSYSVIFKATAIALVGFRLFGVGSITNIKVRQLAGNHAMQSVSAKRPIYRTDGTRHWLKHDLVDDDMTVSLSAMTATTAVSSDDGTAVNYPVSIAAGDYTLTSSSTLGRDYGSVIVNADLSEEEKANLTQYLDNKRGA